jgi:hypothetical protein
MLESDRGKSPYLVRESASQIREHLTLLHSVTTPGTFFVLTKRGGRHIQRLSGAMKRHNNWGMPATHGAAESPAGIDGQRQDPAGVWQKMAGRKGTDRVTV